MKSNRFAGQQKHARYSALRSSACAAVMLLALNGCMPSDNASNENDHGRDFARGQSEYYASAIQQYSMRSQHALTNAAGWMAGAIPEGRLDLTSATFGSLDMGGAEAFIESAYCKSSTTEGLHLTWFDSADSDGDFILKGLGEGKSGWVVRAIKRSVADASFGIWTGTAVKLSDGTTQAIPAGCGALDIPEGSPVIFTSLSLPQDIDTDMVRFEYRTVACPAGETGAVQQQLQVTYHGDGSRTPDGGATLDAGDTRSFAGDDSLAWITTSTNCAAEIELASYEVNAGTTTGIDFDALITSSGIDGESQVAQILDQSLSSMECRRVLEQAEDGEELTDEERELYKTCGASVELAALQSIGATATELVEEEIVTKPCGGTPGTFEDSVDGDVGIATYPAWTGDAVYRREIWSYSVDLTMTGGTGGPGPGCGSCQEMKTIEKWTGLSIECTREEKLKIECETRLPNYSDREVYTVLSAGGFIYNRMNNISGWADPENLVPNDPDNPAWTGYSFDCAWRKDVDWDCSNYPDLNQTRAGAAWRRVEAINIRGDIEAGPWNITSTALCEKERTFNCPGWLMEEGIQKKVVEILDPDGNTSLRDWYTTRNSMCCESRRVGSGCNTQIETRYYTGTAPGIGSWGPWEVVAYEDNCNSGGSGGGGGDGGGGGGDVCIMAGAMVAMADGSVKAIETIAVGDVTVAGRVLQTFARPYDAARHMTAEGKLRIGDSLYEVDGIVATGRHAYLSREGWTELSASAYAAPVNADVAMLYNLVMEHHVVPMVGDSGNVHYYADELNNLGGICEKAMVMLDGRIRKAA